MRALLSVLALVAMAIAFSPLDAHAEKVWGYEQLHIRNTSAASVVQETQWTKALSVTTGFADSSVFRTAGGAAQAETTQAISKARLLRPPSWPGRLASLSRYKAQSLAQGAVGFQDSVAIDTLDTTPWISVRVRQDTLSYDATVSTRLDTVEVAAQWSYDGITWFNVTGTPTRLFENNRLASGGDGLQPVGLIGVELLNSHDAVEIELGFTPTLTGGPIINRNLYDVPGDWLRFIIMTGVNGTGQVYTELGRWAEAR